MKKIQIGFFLIIWAVTITAQDAYATFEQIVAAYQSKQVISYQVEYFYFDDLESVLPSDSLRFQMVQRNDQSYMATDGYILIQEKGRSLTINEAERTIYFQQGKVQAVFDIAKIREMAEEMGLQLQFFEVEESKKGLVFLAPQASNTRIELVCDAKTHLLQDAATQIDVTNGTYQGDFNQSRIKANYYNYRYPKTFDYPIDRFVKKQGSKWKGIGDYQSYEIYVF